MEQQSNLQNTFTDLGFDIERGVEIFQLLNIQGKDLLSPIQVAKLKELSDFVGKYSGGIDLIRRVIINNKNPQMENIDYLTSYVRLQNKKIEQSKLLDDLNEQIKLYE